jgi:hypothetical protein
MKLRYEFFEVANTILFQIMQKEIPMKSAITIARWIREKFQDEYKIYTDMRLKLCEKYCMRDEKGIPILAVHPQTREQEYIFKENQGVFNEEMENLKRIEVELPDLNLKIEDLGDIKIMPQFVLFLEQHGVFKT